MKTKWCLGALIVILTFFGVSQERLVVPNQEIVLQFSSVDVSLNETKTTIANVKKQLENIGVSQIEVSSKTNGRLVISYYSDTAVANIKTILSTTVLAVDYVLNEEKKSNLPAEKTYNLDVFEIQKNSDTGFGSSGKYLFQLKQDYDRFYNPDLNVFASTINSTEKNVEILVAYKLNRTIAIAIKNIPHKIPEGRAGPIV